MGEDVSAQIRTGITVTLVAALIMAVLSLVAVAQNIMASGLNTLHGGVDQILAQEYEKYNQQSIYGTDLKAALSLYQGKDIGIVVRTKSCIDGKTTDSAWAYIYGALLKAQSGTTPTKKTDIDGNPYYVIPSAAIVTQKAGESYFTAEYWVENGLTQFCNNTKSISNTNSTQCILESARFRCYLIKNNTGQIVGIFAEQMS